MKSTNMKINISFKNDERDLKLYEYLMTKRDKSAHIKDLLEIEMLKEKCNA